MERGAFVERRARAFVAHLPRMIAERELETVRRKLAWPLADLEVVEIEDSAGPGNVVSIHIAHEHVVEVVTGFGERKLRSEHVAERAALAVRQYMNATAPVGEHLADQLILPFALARGGRFRALPLSDHTTTNIGVVREFLDVPIDVQGDEPGATVAFG